jgi:hypothetical protein
MKPCGVDNMNALYLHIHSCKISNRCIYSCRHSILIAKAWVQSQGFLYGIFEVKVPTVDIFLRVLASYLAINYPVIFPCSYVIDTGIWDRPDHPAPCHSISLTLVFHLARSQIQSKEAAVNFRR